MLEIFVDSPDPIVHAQGHRVVGDAKLTDTSHVVVMEFVVVVLDV
jgi:hypothetical protein